MDIPTQSEIVSALASSGVTHTWVSYDSGYARYMPKRWHEADAYDIHIVDRKGKMAALLVTKKLILVNLLNGDRRCHRVLRYDNYASIYDLVEAALEYTEKSDEIAMLRKKDLVKLGRGHKKKLTFIKNGITATGIGVGRCRMMMGIV